MSPWQINSVVLPTQNLKHMGTIAFWPFKAYRLPPDTQLALILNLFLGDQKRSHELAQEEEDFQDGHHQQKI